MADYDIVSKQLIRDYPADFVRFTLERENVEVLEVVETEQPTVESREADSLIRVRIDGADALVHSEFQTQDSAPIPMPRRMAGYIGRAIEAHGLPIYSNVIYLRPDAGRRDPGQYVQDLGEYSVVIRYKVIRLIELDGSQVFTRQLWGLLPFAALMRSPGDLGVDPWLRQCIQRIDALPIDRTHKSNFLADFAILGGLVYPYQTLLNIISEETMYESSVAQYIANKGIQQGIQRGRIEDILDVLSIRFGEEAAKTVKSSVEAIDDLQALKRLHGTAVQVASLDEFKKALASEQLNNHR